MPANAKSSCEDSSVCSPRPLRSNFRASNDSGIRAGKRVCPLNDLSGRTRTCGQNKLNAHLFGEERAQETLRWARRSCFPHPSRAWRIARNELTMRPLLQPQLSISSQLIARANDSSRVASEFVRIRKGKSDLPRRIRLDLPLPIKAL